MAIVRRRHLVHVVEHILCLEEIACTLRQVVEASEQPVAEPVCSCRSEAFEIPGLPVRNPVRREAGKDVLIRFIDKAGIEGAEIFIIADEDLALTLEAKEREAQIVAQDLVAARPCSSEVPPLRQDHLCQTRRGLSPLAEIGKIKERNLVPVLLHRLLLSAHQPSSASYACESIIRL